MMDSLAEQVLGLVSTNTRERFSVGKGWPCGPEKPWEVLRNGMGVNRSPVTGSVVGCWSLNTVFSNPWPAVGPGPAIM